MASKKKLLQAAAGSAGGATLDVDDVFSTYLYDGTGSAQTITNGIDLDGEGGLVWIKVRSQAQHHVLFDTEQGATKYLKSSSTSAVATRTDSLTSFNSNGFSLGTDSSGAIVNTSSQDYASWTFRKAPKFFDVVTYTGNGVAGRTISHNLNNLVGMLFIKCLSDNSDWSVQHRMVLPSKYLALNETTSAQTDTARFHSTAASSSSFTVGSGNAVNGSGRTYVAYLFAHHNSGNPGEFGPDADQDVVKCGSFTTNSSGEIPDVNLGFEPQFVLMKAAGANTSWFMMDTMRGYSLTGTQPLEANSSNAETTSWGANTYLGVPTSTGFTQGSSNTGTNNTEWIYMAIRRGPLAEPTSATDVFAIDVRDDTDAPMYKSGFVTDFSLYRDKAANDDWRATSRLLGATSLFPNTTDVENTAYTDHTWDFMNGFHEAGSINTGYLSWMWKRAPGYFDVVAYSGNSTAGRTVSHNLNAVPEMMWVKRRDTGSSDWAVYHSALGNTKQLVLNSTGAEATVNYWNNTTPTATNFTLHSAARVNASGSNYIAYLFATVAGVSKVGSYTGDGTTSKNIDCGFSNGARFVMIRRTDSGGGWIVFDTVRGLTTAAADPFLYLDSTAAQSQNVAFDLDPYSSGFNIGGDAGYINASGGSYIFYAIA